MNPKNERFPAGTLISLGNRKLRHSSEEDLKKEDALQIAPETYPEVLLNVGGLTFEEAVQRGGSDTVVTFQKLIRDKSTIAQVRAWRAGMFAEVGENTVVLDPKATELEVLLQPEDKLDEIRTKAPLIYDAMLAHLDAEQQLEDAPGVYEQMVAMKA